MADERMPIECAGRVIEVSNPGKALFVDSGITKGELARYYGRIGATMLPHVSGRPLTLVRYPKGIGSSGFFQKHTPDHYPEWIRRVELTKKGGVIRHAVVHDTAALVYFAQQNMITPHIGLARAGRLDRPDRFVVDLDPPDPGVGAIGELEVDTADPSDPSHTADPFGMARLRRVANGVREARNMGCRAPIRACPGDRTARSLPE